MDSVVSMTPKGSTDNGRPLRLNILIITMGSRGDLEPAMELAKVLKHDHGHRVRIATHHAYQEAIEAGGFEAYSIGRTNPVQMTVRRDLPGKELRKIIPTIKEEFAEMGERYWGAATDDPAGLPEGSTAAPFVADALVATVTTYAHTSIALSLGIPLHILGTNQRIFTKELPHSQASKKATSESATGNAMSFFFQDVMFFEMLKPALNKLRVNKMGLDSFTPIWWTSQFYRMNVPASMAWSPHIIPKPSDWGKHIEISGFIYPPPKEYDPPADLTHFLDAHEKIIFISFGSQSFLDPLTYIGKVFDAVKQAGVHAVFAKGWFKNLELPDAPEHIFMIKEVPYSWILPRVSAMMGHMGMGTTSAALKFGKPAIMVPARGDQPFWAHRVWKVGSGPEPILSDELTADLLATRIQEALTPASIGAAEAMAVKINQEELGQRIIAGSLLRDCEVYARKGRCDVLPDQTAQWTHRGSGRKLSSVAAHVLVAEKKISEKDLDMFHVVKRPDHFVVGDPISGVVKGIAQAIRNITRDVKSANVFGVLLHILLVPFVVFYYIIFGLYSFLDWLNFELNSVAQPVMFASNPRAYTYGQMMKFLVAAPFKELSSPSLSMPLRFVITLVAIPVGIIAFSLRALNNGVHTLVGSRPGDHVVREIRFRHGKREAERLLSNSVEEGRSDGRGDIVARWSRPHTGSSVEK